MTDVEKKICIPIEERQLNKVERLGNIIKRIQENCEHDFRLIKELELNESLVSGVFVGSLMGPAEVSSDIKMELVCLNCSKKKTTTALNTCPKCLSSMKEGDLFGRKAYFGKDYRSYSVRIQQCLRCSFKVASDEWDR